MKLQVTSECESASAAMDGYGEPVWRWSQGSGDAGEPVSRTTVLPAAYFTSRTNSLKAVEKHS